MILVFGLLRWVLGNFVWMFWICFYRFVIAACSLWLFVFICSLCLLHLDFADCWVFIVIRILGGGFSVFFMFVCLLMFGLGFTAAYIGFIVLIMFDLVFSGFVVIFVRCVFLIGLSDYFSVIIWLFAIGLWFRGGFVGC